MTGTRIPAHSKDLIVLDLETTGLDPAKHEIIDIAAVRYSCDGRCLSLLTTKLKPEHIDTADPEALAVNGYSPEKWYAADRLVDAVDRIRDYLSSPDTIIVGHNVWLDVAFIKAHVPGAVIKYTVDTAALAYGLGFDSMSLDHIIKELGLAVDSPGQRHTALCDALLTAGVFFELRDRIRASQRDRRSHDTSFPGAGE